MHYENFYCTHIWRNRGGQIHMENFRVYYLQSPGPLANLLGSNVYEVMRGFLQQEAFP